MARKSKYGDAIERNLTIEQFLEEHPGTSKHTAIRSMCIYCKRKNKKYPWRVYRKDKENEED